MALPGVPAAPDFATYFTLSGTENRQNNCGYDGHIFREIFWEGGEMPGYEVIREP